MYSILLLCDRQDSIPNPVKATPLRGKVNAYKRNAQKMINAGNPVGARKYCEEKRIPFPPYPEKFVPEDPPYFKPDRIGYTEPGEVETLVEEAAKNILAKGKSIIPKSTSRKTLTPRDRALLTQAIGMAPEEFCEYVSGRLRTLIDKTMERVEEKLDENAHKPADLSFLLAVLIEKQSKLEGHNRVANSSINVQVNNYGPGGQSKEEMMRELGYDVPAPALTLSPAVTIPVTAFPPSAVAIPVSLPPGHSVAPVVPALGEEALV